MIMEFQAIDTFDYNVKIFRETKPVDLTSKLNELGNDGWELVNILQNTNSHPTYIFKRKITTIK